MLIDKPSPFLHPLESASETGLLVEAARRLENGRKDMPEVFSIDLYTFLAGL
jgi:hypothetical protein